MEELSEGCVSRGIGGRVGGIWTQGHGDLVCYRLHDVEVPFLQAIYRTGAGGGVQAKDAHGQQQQLLPHASSLSPPQLPSITTRGAGVLVGARRHRAEQPQLP